MFEGKRFKVLAITNRDDRTFWTRCGVGFPNKDGSITMMLDTLPVSGKLQLRELDEQDLQPRGQRAPLEPGQPSVPPF